MAQNYRNCPYKDKGSRFGGYLVDFPNWENNLRSILFPEYRRVVDVRITTYMGVCLEAVHYFVGFDIETDEILAQKDDGYTEVTPWDMPYKYNPRRMDHLDFIEKELDYDENDDLYWDKFKDKFRDIEFTRRWAIETAEREFPSDKFDVRFDKEHFHKIKGLKYVNED